MNHIVEIDYRVNGFCNVSKRSAYFSAFLALHIVLDSPQTRKMVIDNYNLLITKRYPGLLVLDIAFPHTIEQVNSYCN